MKDGKNMVEVMAIGITTIGLCFGQDEEILVIE